MEERCQVDDNASSTDHISHGLASSIGENRTSMQHQRDTDFSTISSEKIQSATQTCTKSDVSSECGQPSYRDRNDSVVKRADEIIRWDSATKVPHHYEQLKTESLSSKESSEAVRPSSVDSAGPKTCQSLNENSAKNLRRHTCGYIYPTLSEESKNVQEPESSYMITESEAVAAGEHSLHQCKFDLNEGIEADGAECLQQTLQILNSSHAVRVSEPIPVVAKVGVPVGLPKKPLQFGGELGWRRSGDTSAFRPTFLRNYVQEKRGCGFLEVCGSRRPLVSQGIDLNVAATMDSELFADEITVDVSSKQPQRFLLDLNCKNENDENHCKPGALSFDLNGNHMIKETNKNIRQKLSRNCVDVDPAACFGASASKSISECRRSSYWVDLNPMRGLSHVQAQPFLVAAPPAEQLSMVVPLQSELSFMPHAPPGLYVGKINGLSPTFYSPSFLSHLNNQHGAAVIPQISGQALAAYPATLNVLESSQGINPNAFANVRPTFVQNGNIGLVENGNRGANNIELLVPARNALLEDRIKPVEQLIFPSPSTKRREPDGGWEYSQANYRQMAPWR